VRRAEAAGRSGHDLVTEMRTDCLLGGWADPREIAFPILWLGFGRGFLCDRHSHHGRRRHAGDLNRRKLCGPPARIGHPP
jgi:hypothetical protein